MTIFFRMASCRKLYGSLEVAASQPVRSSGAAQAAVSPARRSSPAKLGGGPAVPVAPATQGGWNSSLYDSMMNSDPAPLRFDDDSSSSDCCASEGASVSSIANPCSTPRDGNDTPTSVRGPLPAVADKPHSAVSRPGTSPSASPKLRAPVQRSVTPPSVRPMAHVPAAVRRLASPPSQKSSPAFTPTSFGAPVLRPAGSPAARREPAPRQMPSPAQRASPVVAAAAAEITPTSFGTGGLEHRERTPEPVRDDTPPGLSLSQRPVPTPAGGNPFAEDAPWGRGGLLGRVAPEYERRLAARADRAEHERAAAPARASPSRPWEVESAELERSAAPARASRPWEAEFSEHGRNAAPARVARPWESQEGSGESVPQMGGRTRIGLGVTPSPSPSRGAFPWAGVPSGGRTAASPSPDIENLLEGLPSPVDGGQEGTAPPAWNKMKVSFLEAKFEAMHKCCFCLEGGHQTPFQTSGIYREEPLHWRASYNVT